jgi:hypothetical protein
MSDDTLTGQLHLPVWKQGHDFRDAEGDTNAAALKHLAGRYRLAADICDRIAAACERHPEIDMDGDTHRISVAAAPAVMDLLVAADLVDPDVTEADLDAYETEE